MSSARDAVLKQFQLLFSETILGKMEPAHELACKMIQRRAYVGEIRTRYGYERTGEHRELCFCCIISSMPYVLGDARHHRNVDVSGGLRCQSRALIRAYATPSRIPVRLTIRTCDDETGIGRTRENASAVVHTMTYKEERRMTVSGTRRARLFETSDIDREAHGELRLRCIWMVRRVLSPNSG